jgi:hypothetical protein
MAGSVPSQPPEMTCALPRSALSSRLEELEVLVDPAGSVVVEQGNGICINQRLFNQPWIQWQDPSNQDASDEDQKDQGLKNQEPATIESQSKTIALGIPDFTVVAMTGFPLLPSTNLLEQPIDSSSATAEPLILQTQLTNQTRYLNIAPLIQALHWTVRIQGNLLFIQTAPAEINRLELEPSVNSSRLPSRFILTLDRTTPWQWQQNDTASSLVIDATAAPEVLAQLHRNKPQPDMGKPQPQTLPFTLQSIPGQTTLSFNPGLTFDPTIAALQDPPRLEIDLRPASLPTRKIPWAPGLASEQQEIAIGRDVFPVTYLRIDPKNSQLILAPIWPGPKMQPTIVGTTPLIALAPTWQAIAAINAGFFNRNTQMPLGAVRQNQDWISGPILNRGAIAWDDQGNFLFDRLTLTETLTTNGGVEFPVLYLNSGYVQVGLSRYTAAWGTTYSPLTDHEILIAVQNDSPAETLRERRRGVENYRVTEQQTTGKAGTGNYPIPADGYLLVARAYKTAADQLLPGTSVQLQSKTIPEAFEAYPQILGAGPLLIQNGQIILNAEAERFNPTFSRQSAVRSAIGETAEGQILLVTAQASLTSSGPTLEQMAQIMQELGAVNALNFDGGSSSSLYLGGQLVNRSPQTAARIHNGLGVFLQ